jgi:hypothetical protein
MKRPKYYVGIDISSESFTAAAGTTSWKIVVKAEEFENNPNGFVAFMDWMEEHNIQADNAVLCMEATGVYGEGLAHFVYAHQYRIAIEPPLKVKRAFMPQGHKNDRVDSQKMIEWIASKLLNTAIASMMNCATGSPERRFWSRSRSYWVVSRTLCKWMSWLVTADTYLQNVLPVD